MAHPTGRNTKKSKRIMALQNKARNGTITMYEKQELGTLKRGALRPHTKDRFDKPKAKKKKKVNTQSSGRGSKSKAPGSAKPPQKKPPVATITKSGSGSGSGRKTKVNVHATGNSGTTGRGSKSEAPGSAKKKKPSTYGQGVGGRARLSVKKPSAPKKPKKKENAYQKFLRIRGER